MGCHPWVSDNEKSADKILNVIFLGVSCALLVSCVASAPAETVPLPSWNDGTARKSIIAFVDRITRESSPDFVAPAERIAG